MKTIAVTLDEIASRANLLEALARASRGKADRLEVIGFLNNLDTNLTALSANILSGHAPLGEFRTFTIRDPKLRRIHAACFADRILHHAILNVTEPVFERGLVDSCYACRPGKGVHRAVSAVQRNLRRFPWYAKIDIDAYFASIRADRMKALLRRRFRGAGFLAMLDRLIDAGPGTRLSSVKVGLPIGSLTSQHFANLYLDGADRYLLETVKARAHVRYMDDILWWGDDAQSLHQQLDGLSAYLQSECGLTIKPSSVQIQRSAQGVSYCGFRIKPGVVLASRRKLLRYSAQAKAQHRSTDTGMWSEAQQQRASDSLEATLAHCQSSAWRDRFWTAQHWGLSSRSAAATMTECAADVY
jgi:RNA-directed DNA polymerase